MTASKQRKERIAGRLEFNHGDEVCHAPETTAAHKTRTTTGRRAELLADRIEEGAAGLAAFAEGITEAEWQIPVSSTDRRPVGVIVHHVASMYPIEIDVARAVAGGKAITDVTWEVVAQLNAQACRRKCGRNEGRRARALAAEQSRSGDCGTRVDG